MIGTPPIRILSNAVTIDAAEAVSRFFEMCESAGPDSSYIPMPRIAQVKVMNVDRSMERVAMSQRALLESLELVSEEELANPDFQKVIADLGRLVAQVDANVTDTYDAPAHLVRLWQKNLDTVSEQNAHIDNYLESFRIAFDETCSALLADLATNIIAK